MRTYCSIKLLYNHMIIVISCIVLITDRYWCSGQSLHWWFQQGIPPQGSILISSQTVPMLVKAHAQSKPGYRATSLIWEHWSIEIAWNTCSIKTPKALETLNSLRQWKSHIKCFTRALLTFWLHTILIAMAHESCSQIGKHSIAVTSSLFFSMCAWKELHRLYWELRRQAHPSRPIRTVGQCAFTYNASVKVRIAP